jgi:catechol 2,3-dioxygenase-like lactoylglutathione lyase family enzyme
LQIPAVDLPASGRFYARVFGWQLDPGHPSSFEVLDGPSPDGPRLIATFRDPAGNIVGILQESS